MKRLLIFLLTALLMFSFVGCARKDETPAQTDAAAPAQTEAQPCVIGQLNVEFVRGERDLEALLTLKKTLPPLLIKALAAQGVTAEAVSVTFGTSAEATARSLESGSVHVGFLPSSVYCAHFGEMYAVADRVLSEPQALIGLYLPYGEQNAALLEKLTSVPWGEAFSKEDLREAVWALPANDEAAERYLALRLEENYALGLSELENLQHYADLAERDEALKSANFTVLYGFEAATNNFLAALDNLPLEGETVAVSAADACVSGEAFRTALQNALAALCLDGEGQAALSLYCGGEYANYRAVNDGVYASQRHILGYTEE